MPPSARSLGAVGVLVAVLAAGCAAPEPGPTAPSSLVAPPPTSAAPPPVRPTTTPTSAPEARLTPKAKRTQTPCPRGDEVPEDLSLQGERGRAWAFVPLDGSSSVTVEGRVSSSPAWSTSKVLVVAAYLDAAVDGRPDRLSAADRRRIEAALTRSDADAVTAVRDRIPGRAGRAMTAVLRSIGDTTTVAPDSYQGTMRWSLREQVRFAAALAEGRVVSPAASRYLRSTMRPIPAHAWGLGTIGASAYKGGWLRKGSPTRQLGLVDGYAVAISTELGTVVRQTDGDGAHVAQLNRLARLLQRRLAWEQRCR